MRVTRLLPIVVAAVLLGQGCGWDAIKARRTDTLQTAHVAGSGVSVEARNGRITVTADPTLEHVVIDARITCSGATHEEAETRLDATGIAIARRADGTLEIEPVFPPPRRSGDGADITVRLPAADGVEVTTSNGRIVVEGLAGALTVRTSNGAVTVRDHDGPADIVTSNGAVVVSGHVGTLAVGTSNGNVEAAGVTGPSRIRTSNGSVRLQVGAAFAGPVSFDTSNGSISIFDHAGRVSATNIRRTSGHVVVGEGGQPSVVNTSNGSIKLIVTGS